MRWRGVLLDLFGTVVAPFAMDRHAHALGEVAQAVGLDPQRCHDLWQRDYGNRVRGRAGAIADQVSAIARSEGVQLDADRLARASAAYASFADTLLVPASGAIATLEELRARGVPAGLVSNAAPDFAAAFERSRLAPLFTASVFSCAVGSAKPEPAIYLAAATRLGVPPAELVFVGDGSDDELTGAADAGLTPVLVEVDTSSTYDPTRESVEGWAGLRLTGLPQLLPLLG